MVVKVHPPGVLRSRVDNAEEVLLARLNGPLSVLAGLEIWGGVLAVQQVVVGVQSTIVRDERVHLRSGQIEARAC